MRDESHYTERNIGLDEKTVYQERIIRQQMISEPLRHRVPDRSIKEIITPYQEAYEMKIKLGVKLYLFIIITVLAVAIGTAALAYNINANQIDRYYKQVAFDSAVNFSSFVDVDYLRKLRTAVETDEFQSLRETAEENDDEAAIQNSLEKNDLREGYTETRGKLVRIAFIRRAGRCSKKHSQRQESNRRWTSPVFSRLNIGCWMPATPWTCA